MAKPAILHQKVILLSLEVDGPHEHRETYLGGIVRNDGSIRLGGISTQNGFIGFSRSVLTDSDREVLTQAVLVLLRLGKDTGAV